jgi:hypothetical protein
MGRPPHARRFAGLTLLFLGLVGVFATLTLAAQGKAGWAVLTVLAGIVVAIGGLRLLAREST